MATTPFLAGTVRAYKDGTATVAFVGGDIPCLVPASLAPLAPNDEVIVTDVLFGTGAQKCVIAIMKRAK